MKKKILWVSLCAPYDKVAHGGGKTHNYYLKKAVASSLFDIHLISFCDSSEYDEVVDDLKRYKVLNEIIPWTHDLNVENVKRKFQLWDMEYNIFNCYGGATNKYYWSQLYKCIDAIDYIPDVIVLQWTEIVLFTEKIRKYFPKVPIICIEEDVKFLAYERQIDLCSNLLSKSLMRHKYNVLKKAELSSLCLAKLVITYSNKDKELLLPNIQDHTLVISPYFEKISCYRGRTCNKNIVFYGAMSRKDNYDSAIWFIDNVFNRFEDKELKFIIVGSKPADILYKYANDRIIVTGFVESVEPYFEQSLCLVAPLVSGAGIKIKVLEALSAGIPVLTNDIGIEGIDAENNVHYLHCQSPDEYVFAIERLIEDCEYSKVVSRNAKEMIENRYNIEKDASEFINRVCNIARTEGNK